MESSSWTRDAVLIGGVVRLGTGGGTFFLVFGGPCAAVSAIAAVRFSCTGVPFDASTVGVATTSGDGVPVPAVSKTVGFSGVPFGA